MILLCLLVALLGSSVAGLTIPHTKQQTELKMAAFDSMCIMCTYVAEIAEMYINMEGMNQTQVSAELYAVCGYLPSDYRLECKGFLAVMAPKIIQELLNGGTTDKICTDLHMCTAVPADNSASGGGNSPKLLAIGTQTEVCGICQFTIYALEDYLGSDAADLQTVAQTLQTVCQLLPGDYRNQCHDYTFNNFEMIVQHMTTSKNQISPAAFCSTVNLCGADSLKTKKK